LETQSLRLEARVKEIEYAGGALPPNSGIDKLTIELATWRKDAAGVTAPQPSISTTTISAPPPATPFPATPVAPTPVAPAPIAPQPSFTPQSAPAPMFPTAPQPLPPQSAPLGGGFGPMRPVQPPPMTPPPPARPPVDDDPFGGTGDFRPIR
jgi:hypothetical protein